MSNLSQHDYQSQMRDLSKHYQMLNENPLLSQSSIGRETQARLNTLDARINPTGPNMPMIRGIQNILDR